LTTPIFLVCPVGKEEETIMRLARVGYDNCQAFLQGGFATWKDAGFELATIESISADKFMDRYTSGTRTLDVRKPGEYESAHLTKADNRPLDFIYDWIDNINPSEPILIHCAGGYRSMIAASLLKARGHQALTDVQGGYGAISKVAGVEKEVVKTCANA
jgi:rhodanese-related sulfurtransferase